MASPLVDSTQIREAELLSPLPFYAHAYIWPFAIAWPVFLRYYLTPTLYDRYIGAAEWTFVWCATIITLQSLTWLTTKWSVNLRALFTARRAGRVEGARLIKVVPVANAGSATICDLVVRRETDGGEEISFLFQKRRFLFNPAARTFSPPRFDIDEAGPKPKIAIFQRATGIGTAAELVRLEKHYGPNTFDIPVPTFTELFRDHAVAPFFVFQVFCVGLWMLDEYWKYSLFTLVMLVAFESTVVWQRQRTLTEFRGMNVKPYDVWVHRLGGWVEIRSDRLLPGDLVSVTRTRDDGGVACDMLLVEGGAIVNEAMLSGESTPLLKESIRLRPADASIELEGLDRNALLWGGTKVLQVTPSGAEGGGAEAEAEAQDGAQGGGEDQAARSLEGSARRAAWSAPPDKGAVAVVLKTGFETSQGSLVRTMIYSTEHVSANNAEALFFILFLLVFALAASTYVWQEGVRTDRKRSKLLLDCILIVTSVVPPELPMQLSLSVNTALAALSRYAIFCTEPFRIPFGGRIDVACFDKTGTLTGEDLVVEGIAGLDLMTAWSDSDSDSPPSITAAIEAGIETTLVLASAHALVRLDEGEIVGDPMEKATLASLGWVLGRGDVLSSGGIGGGIGGGGSKAPATAAAATSPAIQGTVHIRRRFQFSSALKRQSSIAVVLGTDPRTGRRVSGTLVAAKGAPETMMKMLVEVPDGYEETYKYFTRRGSRVLALAYRLMDAGSHVKIRDLRREDVERDLSFAGFLVLHCPLKEDARQSVQMLSESSHRVIMITGDNPLTAAHVAREVDIVDREVLILDAPDNDDDHKQPLEWRSVDEGLRVPVDPTKPIDQAVLASRDLCVTGHALALIQGEVGWQTLLRHTWVYARVSPRQKEDILLGLKDMGYYTLMAGDGTNDVGALKQAHIGVALLNGTRQDLVRIADHQRNTKLREIYEKQCSLMKRFNQPTPMVPVTIAHLFPPGPTNPHYGAAIEREAKRENQSPAEYIKAHGLAAIPPPGQVQLPAPAPASAPALKRRRTDGPSFAETIQNKMLESEMGGGGAGGDDEPPALKLGDASVAAPFTSKLRDVAAIPNIVRQGRCTLVATIQMYKILALNCLITAYSLSVLYLEGIKFSDSQYTISGILMSVCFMSLSRARSVEGLSRERPQPNIFNVYIIGSILGQFVVHVATLIFVARMCDRLEPRNDSVDLEAEFKPGLLNSGIYLLQLIQQISTVAVNYQGRPFRESLSENRAMFYGIVGVTALAFSCSIELVPEINTALSLVPFVDDFRIRLTAAMALDYGACWVIEATLKRFFSDFRPRDIAARRPDQLQRESERRAREEKEKEEKEEQARLEKVAEFEKRMDQRKKEIQARWTGGNQKEGGGK